MFEPTLFWPRKGSVATLLSLVLLWAGITCKQCCGFSVQQNLLKFEIRYLELGVGVHVLLFKWISHSIYLQPQQHFKVASLLCFVQFVSQCEDPAHKVLVTFTFYSLSVHCVVSGGRAIKGLDIFAFSLIGRPINGLV